MIILAKPFFCCTLASQGFHINTVIVLTFPFVSINHMK